MVMAIDSTPYLNWLSTRACVTSLSIVFNVGVEITQPNIDPEIPWFTEVIPSLLITP